MNFMVGLRLPLMETLCLIQAFIESGSERWTMREACVFRWIVVSKGQILHGEAWIGE
jgi:hypothetical protein